MRRRRFSKVEDEDEHDCSWWFRGGEVARTVMSVTWVCVVIARCLSMMRRKNVGLFSRWSEGERKWTVVCDDGGCGSREEEG